MEKIYMEAPTPRTTRMWKPNDISPYDFKDDLQSESDRPVMRNQQRNDMRNEPRNEYKNDVRSDMRNDMGNDERNYRGDTRNDSISRGNMNDSRLPQSEHPMNEYDMGEDDLDMDALMEDMNRLDDEMENEIYREADMYDNRNIDWQCGEDVSQRCRNHMIQRKSVIEEENPKRTITTWMRIVREC